MVDKIAYVNILVKPGDLENRNEAAMMEARRGGAGNLGKHPGLLIHA